MMIKSRRGQIWVETVIYTLIGLTLIGITLAFLTPKINETRDRSVIEQTISSLQTMDGKINEILRAPGNKRIVEFKMERGVIAFDGENDLIRYSLNDSQVIFSEPGIPVRLGKITVLTTEGQKTHSVVLTLDYNFDMTVNGEEGVLEFDSSPTPYSFSFENKGFVDVDGTTLENIDVSEIG